MIYYKDLVFVDSRKLWEKVKQYREDTGMSNQEVKRLCEKHGIEYQTFWSKLCGYKKMWYKAQFFIEFCNYIFRRTSEFDTTDEDVKSVLCASLVPVPIREYIENDIVELSKYMCRKNISSASTIARHIVGGPEARRIINTNSKTIIKYIIKKAVKRVNSMTGSERRQHMNTMEYQTEKFKDVQGKYKFVKSYPHGFNVWSYMGGYGDNKMLLSEAFYWNINPNAIEKKGDK